MATLADVATIALGLPEVTEADGERRSWAVTVPGTKPKVIAWERPFSKADIKRYGDQPPPDGPIVALRTADLAEKEAILAQGRRGFFTIPHFNGYAGYLIQLPSVTKSALREAIVDAWLAAAPPAVAEQYLSRRRVPRAVGDDPGSARSRGPAGRGRSARA
jgi:hypothetical protein